jgi:hypothetical protein
MGAELKDSSGLLKKETSWASGRPEALSRPASLAQGVLTPFKGTTGPSTGLDIDSSGITSGITFGLPRVQPATKMIKIARRLINKDLPRTVKVAEDD